MDVEALLQSLKENVCIVEYEKVNPEDLGSVRAMACTLMPSRIPTHTKIDQNATTDQVLVWCTDKNAWRSVFVNTIKDWRVITDA